MRGEELLHALNRVDAALIDEAARAGTRKKRRLTAVLGSAAACFALLAALAVLPAPQPDSGVFSENEGGQSPASNLDERQRGGSEITIDLSDVRVFPLDDTAADAARIYYDPETYDEVVWQRDDIVDYYGWDLTPPYLPAGFAPRMRGISATVYYDKSGVLVDDQVGRGFYHAYYDDGSPRLTDDVAALCGFSITASRLGKPFRCGIIVFDDEMESTTINGTPVRIGYRAMPYGPYDPETHEPAGYYDTYVVQFDKDGAYYDLVFDQLPLQEAMRIAASILCDTPAVTVTGAVQDAPYRSPSTLDGVLRYLAGLLQGAAGKFEV